MVLNLLTNAVKFTPDGGRVTVNAYRDGDDIAITVTDTGVGVPEADRDRIFESFQQGGRSPGAEEGTGLGLTLSRRIVHLHGGRMWLASQTGRGSTFGFAIPAGSRPGPASTVLGAEAGSGIVLVVEDDRPSQELMSILLMDQGLQVEVVPTGEQALERLRGGVPTAVVLDIQLPGIDGWEVLARIKGRPCDCAGADRGGVDTRREQSWHRPRG